MQPIRALFIVALLAVSSFAQSIVVTPFEAIIAKSVKVEQLADKVAVILTDREAGVKTGAYLQVASPAKWATPLLDGITITQTKQPGEWVLYAPAGKYRVLLAEFDPETGPRYTYHDLVIGKVSPNPDPTPVPDGDFAALKKVAKEAADKLADQPTRNALVTAYKSVVATGKTYDELVTITRMARRAALQSRNGDSLAKDWSEWLVAVDAELVKVVKPGDAAAYIAALKAIVEGLSGV